MAKIKVDPFSLCPFRSPVEVPPEEKLYTVSGEKPENKPPRSALGPCLGLACGFWCVTKVVDRQPTDGACAARVAAEALVVIMNRFSMPSMQKESTSPPPSA